MDRAAVGQRLAKIEERIANGLREIAEQRQVIAVLERHGSAADHARYLLAGLELLQAAHRDGRNRLLKKLHGRRDSADAW